MSYPGEFLSEADVEMEQHVERIIAPISRILPSFIPVKIERGVPGYASSELLVPGERRLSEEEVKVLLLASTIIGLLVTFSSKGIDWEGGLAQALKSLDEISDLTSSEQKKALELVRDFRKYRIIRENHNLDDWVTEAWWGQFQAVPYAYPSAMSNLVGYGMTIAQTLEKCVIVEG